MPRAGLWGARTRTAPTRGPRLDSSPPGRGELALKRRKTSLSSRVPGRLACPGISPGHPCPAPAPRCQCLHPGRVPGSRDSRGPTGGPCLGENQREERVPPTTERRARRGWGAGGGLAPPSLGKTRPRPGKLQAKFAWPGSRPSLASPGHRVGSWPLEVGEEQPGKSADS